MADGNRLLIVHSSAELYGSDRSLLDFVSRQQVGFDITVLLPQYGPLCAQLEASGAHVVVGDVCKLQRQMLGIRGVLTMISSAVKSVRELKKIEREKPFDVVYSNTVAVFAGALYALLFRRPHVWHVREILVGSPLATVCFRVIVSLFSKLIICNSSQTRNWIITTRSQERYLVVWNGVPVALAPGQRANERMMRGWSSDAVVIVVAGRINSWKGQLLLVEAFELMRRSGNREAKLWIIGSAFSGQERYEHELSQRVADSPFYNDILIEPFRPDIEVVWEACDIVAVPSTEPEPFGRVAIEAMAFGRPVIAAAHGGLLDIVEDGVSGVLFKPRDAKSLAHGLSRLVQNSDLRSAFGRAALSRQRQLFSVESYVKQVSDVLSTAKVGVH